MFVYQDKSLSTKPMVYLKSKQNIEFDSCVHSLIWGKIIAVFKSCHLVCIHYLIAYFLYTPYSSCLSRLDWTSWGSVTTSRWCSSLQTHVNYVPFNYSKAVWATRFQFWSVFLYILLQRCKRTQLTHSWHVARVVLSFLPELKIPAVVFTLLSLHCFAAFNGNPEDDTGFWIKWRIRKHACTLSNRLSTTYHWHFL